MLNVDGWTDERMNGWKLARLCLPAKAGATKTPFGLPKSGLINEVVLIWRKLPFGTGSLVLIVKWS